MSSAQIGAVAEKVRIYAGRAIAHCIPSEIVDAYCTLHDMDPAHAQDQAAETKRFTAIRAAVDGPARNGDFRIGMSGPVDRFWHFFLLYSPEYFDFCEQVCGFYIQHRPNPPGLPKWQEVDRLLNLLDVYETAFGHPPPPDIWTLTRESVIERLRDG